MHDEDLREVLRRWLGINRLERQVMKARDQLADLRTQVSDFISDVDARLDSLAQKQGDFEPEAQAEFDQLKEAVAAADARVGDADGSDTAAPAPGETTGEPTGEPDTQTPEGEGQGF